MCSRRPGTYWLYFAFGVTMRPWLAASSSPEKMFHGGPQNIEHAESGLDGTGQDTKDPLEILHGAITRKVEALSQPYAEEMKDESAHEGLYGMLQNLEKLGQRNTKDLRQFCNNMLQVLEGLVGMFAGSQQRGGHNVHEDGILGHLAFLMGILVLLLSMCSIVCCMHQRMHGPPRFEGRHSAVVSSVHGNCHAEGATGLECGPIAALQVTGSVKELVREIPPGQLRDGVVDQAVAEFLHLHRMQGEGIDAFLVRYDVLRHRAGNQGGLGINERPGLCDGVSEHGGLSNAAERILLAKAGNPREELNSSEAFWKVTSADDLSERTFPVDASGV
ncbi:unnamed protein product [Effrenium voratum]|nr:unnamed protein product [Effrenium voratum]